MRSVAIIQARMGSSRLPGKVLLPIAGRPVLWHIIHRLRKCTTLDTIAIATSTSAADDPIVAFARHEQIECVRGPEDNVLERYALAAKQLKPDIIIRITGDVPLIDPSIIDRMVKALKETGADLCSGEPDVDCIHEGIDPFSSSALQRVVDEASDDPAAREHVIAYFHKHPERFTKCTIPIDPAHQFKGARISVDTPADFIFQEQVYTRLNVEAGEADLGDVVRLLKSDPSLLAINANVHQKGIEEKNRRILVRCDGDARIGLGHVYRCMALAEELRTAHGCGVSFAMATGSVGIELVRKASYPVDIKPVDVAKDDWMDGVIARLNPDALVLDVRDGIAREAVRTWRKQSVLIVDLDDPEDKRLEADLAFYPPVPQIERMDWSDFSGLLHAGWEWIVLRREFGLPPQDMPIRSSSREPVCLVTMGGSDPAGLTITALKTLAELPGAFTVLAVIGQGFMHHEALKSLEMPKGRFDVWRNVTDMRALMEQADLAVASFGVTAYELACMGVPAVFLCLTDDHAQSASAFVKAGMAVSLGRYDLATQADLRGAAASLLEDPSRRAAMSRAAHQNVDGKGVSRIAQCIMERLSHGSA
jgi:spore coat polysaccharide biosynthesis protein SpsF